MKLRMGDYWLMFGGVALILLASQTPARAGGSYPKTLSPGFFDRPGTSPSQSGKYPTSVAPGMFDRPQKPLGYAHVDPLASIRGHVYPNKDKAKIGSSSGRRGGGGMGGLKGGGGAHHAAAAHHHHHHH